MAGKQAEMDAGSVEGVLMNIPWEKVIHVRRHIGMGTSDTDIARELGITSYSVRAFRKAHQKDILDGYNGQRYDDVGPRELAHEGTSIYLAPSPNPRTWIAISHSAADKIAKGA